MNKIPQNDPKKRPYYVRLWGGAFLEPWVAFGGGLGPLDSNETYESHPRFGLFLALLYSCPNLTIELQPFRKNHLTGFLNAKNQTKHEKSLRSLASIILTSRNIYMNMYILIIYIYRYILRTSY